MCVVARAAAATAGGTATRSQGISMMLHMLGRPGQPELSRQVHLLQPQVLDCRQQRVLRGMFQCPLLLLSHQSH